MKTVAIIGVGNMGTAISRRLSADYNLVLVEEKSNNIADVGKADFIIIAVKPQHFSKLAKDLGSHINSQIIISIMAGVTISTVQTALNSYRVIRTMPNLALANGNSMTAVYSFDDSIIKLAEKILLAWGTYMVLRDELLFDPFTAIAGSGPAYFFTLAASLKSAAQDYGFASAEADMMAVNTLKGAADVIEKNPQSWVNKVASKGGTTAAALEVLDKQKFDEIINRAVGAAAKRSKELGVK